MKIKVNTEYGKYEAEIKNGLISHETLEGDKLRWIDSMAFTGMQAVLFEMEDRKKMAEAILNAR